MADLALEKVYDSDFNGMECDYFVDLDGELYMTRAQIGAALGYRNPEKSISQIHRRYADRLDKMSVQFIVSVNRGNHTDNHKVYYYTAKGVYEICRWSRQPLANAFYDHVYKILEGLRLGQLQIRATEKACNFRHARITGTAARLIETGSIKDYIAWAESQGSKHADWYYKHYTQLATKVLGITDVPRDELSEMQLMNLAVVEQAIDRQIKIELATGEEYHMIYDKVKASIYQLGELAFGFVPPKLKAPPAEGQPPALEAPAPEEKPKRKRGRPRKKASVANEAVSDLPQ